MGKGGGQAESEREKQVMCCEVEMYEKEGRKEQNRRRNSRPISLSQGEIVDQYSQLRSNKTLSPSRSVQCVQ